MPLHSFQCGNCNHAFDSLLGFDEEGPKKCPGCGRRKLTRLFGVPNVVVRYSPKTIGQLAEQNTRELVAREGRERARQIIHDKSYAGGRKLKVPKGASIIPRPGGKAEVPWFRDGSVEGTGPRREKPLDVGRVKNVEKYVHTGDPT